MSAEIKVYNLSLNHTHVAHVQLLMSVLIIINEE